MATLASGPGRPQLGLATTASSSRTATSVAAASSLFWGINRLVFENFTPDGRHVALTHETVTVRRPGTPTEHRALRHRDGIGTRGAAQDHVAIVVALRVEDRRPSTRLDPREGRPERDVRVREREQDIPAIGVPGSASAGLRVAQLASGRVSRGRDGAVPVLPDTSLPGRRARPARTSNASVSTTQSAAVAHASPADRGAIHVMVSQVRTRMMAESRKAKENFPSSSVRAIRKRIGPRTSRQIPGPTRST